MEPETHKQPNSNALVVYFSRSGFTEKIAREIADAHDQLLDIEAIEEPSSRDGWWGYVKSCLEVIGKKCPKILPTKVDLSAYELVIVGAPVWASNMASPVRTFLRDHRSEIKNAAFFCTYGGSGADKALAEMARLYGSEAIAELAVTDREIGNGDYVERLSAFVSDIEERFAVQGPVRVSRTL